MAFDTVTHTAGAPPAPRARAAGPRWPRGCAPTAPRSSCTSPTPPRCDPTRWCPRGSRSTAARSSWRRFRGSGGGRTLLLNGHVDVVDVEPRADWAQPDPFAAVVRDGLLYGRGACDMKGGVACMIVAAAMLAELGVPLAGDLIVNTVTEEESTGAGGLVAARLLQADAAIVPEPSGLAVWIACRGSLLPRITVHGRAGPRGHRAAAAGAGRRRQRDREDDDRPGRGRAACARHWAAAAASIRYLSPADCVPTIIAGGEWLVSYPAALHARVPHRVPARAGGRRGLRLAASSASSSAGSRGPRQRDPWLREHPPEIVWGVGGVPPAEVAEDDPIVQALVAAGRDLGAAGRAGRPRQLARRRDAHGRGRHPRGLLRPGRRRIARTRSTSTCRSTTSSPAPSARAGGDALLRDARGLTLDVPLAVSGMSRVRPFMSRPLR